MSLAMFGVFMTFCCISAFTPGPNNIFALNAGARFGLRGSLSAISGMSLGFLLVMLVCGYLLLSLSTLSETFLLRLRYVGCAYIVWLAWKVATAKPDASTRQDRHGNFLAGFILQFFNVKIIFYGLTAFSTFIIPHYDSSLSIPAFALLLTMLTCASQFTWASAGALLERFLARHAKITNLVMGLLLLGCAVSLLA